jgi:hypothetical protein
VSEPRLRATLETLRGDPDALIQIIVQQAEVIARLTAQVEALEARVRDLDEQNRGLRARVATLERTTARAAAPFRIDPAKRQTTRGRRGRPPGRPGTARPRPTHVDVVLEAPLPHCPHCAHPVADVRPRVQYIEEWPPIRPHVTQVTTYEGYCATCGRRVRSTHPVQVSGATGAAGVHLGARALALAALLNKHYGLTMRKTCAVLHVLGGMRLTPGGLTQALARVATRVRASYDALVAQIRAGPLVHSDETSWWVGGPGYWLWVFTRPDLTVYRVAPGRGRQVVEQTLGPTYPGVVVSDCLATYDGLASPQQKCYAHHLRAVRAVLEQGPSAYADQWGRLLRAAMARTPAAPDARTRHLWEIAVDEYLAAPRRAPAEEALRRRLAKQRDHLFTFLDYPDVPATNNLAERQLRPAVIARKLSCGNKTLAGAYTWETLASLAATCAQRGESFLEFLVPRLRLAEIR